VHVNLTTTLSKSEHLLKNYLLSPIN